MAKSKSLLSPSRLLGLGSSKPKKSKAKPTTVRSYIRNRIILFILAIITGSGGALGVNEMEWVTLIRNILRDRIHLRLPSRTTSGPDANAVAGEQIRVYFTKPENGGEKEGDIAHALVGYIDLTKETLDVCAFELDNRLITEALVRAVKRNVKVRLVTETDYLHESGVTSLKAVGVPVVDDKRTGSLMHNKFIVFDNRAVWTGSMNFTENCAYRNNNNGLIIDDALLAKNYATKFSWFFEQRKFGGLPNKTDAIPNPIIRLRDGTQIENYFSTHDHLAKHVISTLGLAKRSIHFLAFSFTHDDIGRTMMQKAANGIEVMGVFEKTQAASTHTEYTRMKNARLPVYIDGNPRNMHHKVIIIDDEIVITGSFNFSDSADTSNDENLLIIYDRELAQLYEAEFDKVYKEAEGAAQK
jgi:phosphatidylserine/phosphatidylglycerophosphate/cardiolipin synthase-like enzyme